MSDEQTEATIGLRNIYLKDASFESPNSPHIFNFNKEPEIDVNLEITADEIDAPSNFYEVIIHITCTAKVDDKTMFLVDLKQAGVFELKGFDKETLSAIIHVYCPTQLYPYVRESVATLIGKGGFPPLLLDPINFEELHANRPEQETVN